MKATPILILFSLLLGLGCKENQAPEENSDDLQMIHVSHTRGWDNSVVDPAIKSIDYATYNIRLLGGDIANQTSLDVPIMNTWDEIFNFGSFQTLWALGNHDYTDLSLVSAYTQRDAFYTYHQNGITFLVLDTQDDFSNISNEQLELVTSVLDTISESKYLILNHHKLIWMYGHPELEPMINNVANGELGTCFYCTNPNNFYDDVYPLLVEAENRGVDVICVGGDLGFKVKAFEYFTSDGIQYLASGCNLVGEDSVLIFDYFLDEKELDWSFRGLSEL